MVTRKTECKTKQNR